MLRLFIAAAAAILCIAPAAANTDEDSVRHLMLATFDKPEARLVVEPVVVAGDHAIAGWAQQDLGGRALLRRRHGTWSLVLCSGDGIKSAEGLRQSGVPVGDAAVLAGRLADAERQLPAARLVLFAKFEGTVMMDAAGNHPPVTHGQAQHAQMQQAAPAATFKIGDLTIETPWLRATPQGAKVAGGYMKIMNNGKEADRLVGGTLDRAGRFEVHEMSMVGNVMQMRPLPNGLEIKPGEAVELKPGGFHIMGMDLQSGYTAGQSVKGTLTFAKAGTVAVEYKVEPIGAGAPAAKHGH